MFWKLTAGNWWNKWLPNSKIDKIIRQRYEELVLMVRNIEAENKFGLKLSFEARVELVMLHVVLLINFVNFPEKSSKKYKQKFFDYFVDCLSLDLRETGVSDYSISRKTKKAVAAFYGRNLAYAICLKNQDMPGLVEVLKRNFAGKVDNMDFSVFKLSEYVKYEKNRLASLNFEKDCLWNK